MTKDRALKLALDALEGFIPYLPLRDETQCNRYDKAITAIKEAIETKDEPVGWIDNKGNMICTKTDESCRPLYTSPQLETKEYERGFIDGMQKQMESSVDKAVNAMSKSEGVDSGWRKRQVQKVVEDDDDIQDYKKPWVGLTDREIEHLSQKWRIIYGNWVTEFVEEIELMLKERNT